jgi:hypothetical protein
MKPLARMPRPPALKRAAQRELAQAQASRDAFVCRLCGSRSSCSAGRRMRCCGTAPHRRALSQEAAHLILQLQNMRAAQEHVAQAARDQAEAQRLAAREQAGRDTFIDRAAAAGRKPSGARARSCLSSAPLQLGVSNQAAPFIARSARGGRRAGAHRRLGGADGGGPADGSSAGYRHRHVAPGRAGSADRVPAAGWSAAGYVRQQWRCGARARRLRHEPDHAVLGRHGSGRCMWLARRTTRAARKRASIRRPLSRPAMLRAPPPISSQLMAQHISSSVGTQGAAAEALAALVATGKVAAETAWTASAPSAVRGQRALGQSVADTAGEFAELAKSPGSRRSRS